MFICSATAQENWDWSQFYVGVGLTSGSSMARPSGDFSVTINGVTTDGLSPDMSLDGFALAGVMHQFDRLVIGLEGEIDLASAYPLGYGLVLPAEYRCFDSGETCGRIDVQGTMDPLGRIRAVFGYALDERVLLFGTAGISAADFAIAGIVAEASGGVPSSIAETPVWDVRGRLIGATFGVGAQFKATDNISVRAEVNHDSYGTLQVPAEGRRIVAPGVEAEFATGDTMSFSRTEVRAAIIVGF